MADPLSIASGIAGLITLADIVIERTYNTIKRCKSAGSDAQKFLLEVQSLLGILRSLHVLELQVSKAAFQSKIPATQQYRCQQMLERLRDKLTEADPRGVDSKLRKLERTLKWPFTYSETEQTLAEIERYKTTFNLAVSMDVLESVLNISAEQTDVTDSVQVIEDHLCRIEMDRKRRDVLSFFGTYDSEPNHSTSLALREPGTGLWLTESPEFLEWLSQPKGKLWLYGIPGAGKTVLAGAVIEEAFKIASAHIGVAYHYCDYKRAASRELTNVLASIAGQLAKQNKPCFDILRSVYQDTDGMPIRSLPDVNLLKTALSRMFLEFDEVALLVDALDEAHDAAGVARTLHELSSVSSAYVRLLLLSRDELDIRQELVTIPAMSIAARSSDLRLFVSSQIEERVRTRKLRIKSPQLKDEILDRLVNGADGMFRWVVCQMDHLCELPTDADRRKALTTLPPDLNSTYARILGRIDKLGEATKLLVQRVLTWLINDESVVPSSRLSRLTASQLSQAISIEHGQQSIDPEATVDIDEILLRCSSLTRLSHDGELIEIAHFTVEEYLRQSLPTSDSILGRYRYDAPSAQLYKVRTCLTFLQMEQFRHMAQSQRALQKRHALYPFYEFAVAAWFCFISDEHYSNLELSLCRTLFTSGATSSYGTWAQALVLPMMPGYAGSLSEQEVRGRNFAASKTLTRVPPLHFACIARCREMIKWLVHGGIDVNHESVLGSPIQVAMLGLSNTIDIFMSSHLSLEIVPIPEADVASSKVVQTLVAEGAHLNGSLFSTPEDKSFSTFTLALLTGHLADVKVSGSSCGREMLQYVVNRCTKSGISSKFTDESTMQLVDSLLEKISLADVGEEEKPLYNVLVKCQRQPPAAENAYDGLSDNLLRDLAHMTHEQAAIFACNIDDAEMLRYLHVHHSLDFLSVADPETKQTLPFLAAIRASKDSLSWMLQNGLDVNTRNVAGLTMLHLLSDQWDDFGSRHTFSSVVRLLLSVPGVDIEAKTPDGETALMRTNLGLSGSVFPDLLDAGADYMARDSNEATIWHKNIHSSGSANFEALVTKAQADGVDILSELVRTDRHGRSPLSDSWNGERTLLERLLENGLLEGMLYNHALKASLNKIREQVLHASAMSGLVDVLQQQLDAGTPIDSVDESGRTALHSAASAGRVETVRLLVRYGADTHARDFRLHTPLHCAVLEGHDDVVAALMGTNPVDIGSRSDLCDAPIYTAAVEGHLKTIIILTQKGADIDACCGSCGSARARLLTGTFGPAHNISFALNWGGVLIDPTALWNVESVHRSVLKKVARRYDAVRRFGDINAMQMVQYEHRAHPTRPLYEVVIFDRRSLVSTLLDHGAMINLEAGPEGTPLMAACAYGRLKCVKTLVRLGAVECYYKHGKLITALAKAHQHREVVHWLLVDRFTDQRKLDCYDRQAVEDMEPSIHEPTAATQRPISHSLDVVLEEDWVEYLNKRQPMSNTIFIGHWAEPCYDIEVDGR